MHTTARCLLFLTVLSLLSAACTKKDVPKLTAPDVLLTPGILDGHPGQTVITNLTITSLNQVNRLEIIENYKGVQRTLVDSSFNPPKSVIDRQFLYEIADTTAVGEQISILFTAHDTKGLSTTKDLDVRVVGQQPVVTVNPETSTRSPGDTITITADISSNQQNLDQLIITQQINDQPITVIQTIDLNGQQVAVYRFPYTVPVSTVSGDKIYLIFTGSDTAGNLAEDSHVITVQ